jgi:hypothetical protein
MADYNPTYGGKLIVGIGTQSDKDTQAGSLTYFYAKPAGVLPKTSFGYKREKFAGGGRVAASFKAQGDGTAKPKIITAWSPGISDLLFSTSGIGSSLGAPVYVTLEYNLIGSAKWTVIGAICNTWKLTGKKSQGFWQLEIDYDAVHPYVPADAPADGSEPTVGSAFAPLMWSDFSPATLLNGASSVKRIGSVEITVAHNLASYPGNNGSAFPSDQIPTDPDVKLMMEMLFVNKLACQQYLTTAQAAGSITLPVGAHTISLSNMEYMDYDVDAQDINKPSIEKITAESIPSAPTSSLLGIS